MNTWQTLLPTVKHTYHQVTQHLRSNPRNPQTHPYPKIQQDTLHCASGMVCFPIYPQVTITRLSNKCPGWCCCCFTSPPPLPPADWAACLPARSAGPEVVTQQLVPRTAHLAVLPSHTSVPEGAQQGRGKSSLLPATCRPTSCCPLLISCLHGLTSVGGKGRRTRAPPPQVETLPGAHKLGSLPSQHTRTQHLLGHVNTGHNGNCRYYQQACW